MGKSVNSNTRTKAKKRSFNIEPQRDDFFFALLIILIFPLTHTLSSQNIHTNSILFSRNNRPKSTQSVRVEPTNLTNFVTSIPKSSPAIQYEFLQQRLRDDFQSSSGTSLDNLNSKMQVGRQGPIKDVKSLIDDFRQQHPEEVPRRGRRVKNTGMGQAGFLGESSASLGRDNDISSPPSSNDSTYGNQQLLVSTAAKVGVSSPYNLISTSELTRSDSVLGNFI